LTLSPPCCPSFLRLPIGCASRPPDLIPANEDHKPRTVCGAGAVAAMKTINSVADCLAGVGAYAFGIIATSAYGDGPKEARTSKGCDWVAKQLEVIRTADTRGISRTFVAGLHRGGVTLRTADRVTWLGLTSSGIAQ
jgi:hypothetical protein